MRLEKRRLCAMLAVCVLLTAGIYAIMRAKNARAAAAFNGRDSVPITLIIDPGHGGDDGGAVSVLGRKESEINLDIGLRMAVLSDFFGREALLTRSSEQLDYPKEATSTAARKVWDTRDRVERINAVENAVLISIHQNNYPDPWPRGPQVFYGAEEGSAVLGELVQTALTAQLFPQNRRLAAPVAKDVYIMAHARHPAVLMECGFLSNPGEAELLETNHYKLKIAVTIMGSYLQYRETEDEGKDDILLH